MKDLDISSLPLQFVSFWWLSKLIKYYDKLIISKEQAPIFGAGGEMWDLYRDHLILIKRKNGKLYTKKGEFKL